MSTHNAESNGPQRSSAGRANPASGGAGQRSQFQNPAQAVRLVLERLWERWGELPEGVQEQLATLLDQLIRGLEEAELDAQRGKVVNDFLNALDQLPAVRQLAGDILDQARRPVMRGSKVTAEEAQELVSWLRPEEAMLPAGEEVREFVQPIMPVPGEAVPEEVTGEEAVAVESVGAEEAGPSAEETSVAFHTKVDFPAQIAISDRAVPLIVQLTLERPQVTVARDIVRIGFEDVTRPEPLEVVLTAEDFREETGSFTRTMLVYADRDSQPAVFVLTPQATGRKRIVLDFRHRDRSVGTASFYTEVQAQPPQDRETRAALEPLLREPTSAAAGQPTDLSTTEASSTNGGVAVLPTVELPQNPPDPVDLELRITTSADHRELSYMLHSPWGRVGYHWTRAGSVRLEAEPRYFFEETFARLSRMARSHRERRTAEEDRAYRQTLTEIGQYLYERLFSPELKTEYRNIRRLQQEGLVRNLLITSDEPWIPWELVKPYESDETSGETLFDDDFLCVQFRLSRWLAGRGVPDLVRVKVAQLVAPSSNLPYVQREKQYFDELPEHHPPLDVNPLIDSSTQVREALRNARAQLFHFACHGDFDYRNPDESILVLKDETFAPSQIVGPLRAGITRSRPLVFLNACHSGQVGFTLTGLGGWAERFVKAGASAFVGTLWEVNDRLAAEFAVHFYEQLWAGEALGDAFYSARMHIRELDEANPTWLAYTLYADPNGHARLSSP